jgi:cation transport ATPase
LAAANKGRASRKVRIAVLFVLSYMVMILIGSFTPLREWPVQDLNPAKTDYMIFLLPVAGFFISLAAIKWFDSFFEKKLGSSVAYPVTVAVAGTVAYYIAIWFFFDNMAKLGSQVTFDFTKLFIQSHYIYFLISALLAWVSVKLVEHLPE